MEIKVVSNQIRTHKPEGLLCAQYQNRKELPSAFPQFDTLFKDCITRSLSHKRFSGELNELELFHNCQSEQPELVAILGLGKINELTSDKLRQAVGHTIRILNRKHITRVSMPLLGEGSKLNALERAQSITEGILLGLYSFHRYKTAKKKSTDLKQVTIVCTKSEKTAVRTGVKNGQIMCQAALLARDLANEPSNKMYPADLANIASEIAQKHTLPISILEKSDMEALGMQAALSVSQGSAQAPKLIILSYRGKTDEKVDLALVGKGITFDSGGISLKPADGMGNMKGDMAGAASVIAAMSAIAQLKPCINVTAVVIAVENMPSGTAYKPGDIVKVMNGTTIEIISTDAEGRLTLADAVSYVNSSIKPKYIVDVATLTGACIIALGHVASAVISNNQALANKIITAGCKTGELCWQLPAFEEYRTQNKSEIADLKNTGGRPAGTITAGLFVGEFAGSTPWAHMDIAGVDQSEKEYGYITKGATGIPVRTLVTLALDLAQKLND
ncbi:MAG: leucyl aminopeptidase [Dehalococcoidia bacterium]|nr:leucyl aminopeptidase [Dehalococcoidia bacterium]